MTTYHNSQVTFFKKTDSPDLDKELDKYRPWIDSIVFNTITEKIGKVAGVSIDSGNVWFKISNEI